MTREELGNNISANIASVTMGCTNIEVTSAIMKDIDLYAPRPTASISEGRGEPARWQFRDLAPDSNQRDWTGSMTHSEFTAFKSRFAHDLAAGTIEIRPLYVAPPSPDVARGAAIEQCAKVAENFYAVELEDRLKPALEVGKVAAQQIAGAIRALSKSGQSPVPAESAPVFKATQNIAESEPSATPVCAGADTQSPAPAPGSGEAMESALRDIVSWKEDTLGKRPKEQGSYDCPPEITEAFDRGARMAFYRCALRASEALSPRSEVAATGTWHLIETAPKDGTPIEACNTRHPDSAPVIVRWDNDGLSEDLPEPHWCDAATRAGDALYYNQNYFDFWRPTTALPRPDREAP